MIVADTNLITYLLLGGQNYPAVRATFLLDPEWAAPLLWRSEFRSVLLKYMRGGHLALVDALRLHDRAESLVAGREHAVRTDDVLALAEKSGCSAYDCEFAALAASLGVHLVTEDRGMLAAFPHLAVTPATFALSGGERN